MIGEKEKKVGIFKSQLFWNSLLVGLIAFIISFLYSITDFFRYDSSVVEKVVQENGMLLVQRLIISGIFCFIFTLIAYIIGYKLKISKHEKMNTLDWCIFFASFIIIPLGIAFIDKALMTSSSENFVSVQYTIYNLFSSILYNGVLTEVWFRYGIISFIIFLIAKVFYKGKIDKKAYIFGILFGSLFLFSIEFSAFLNIYRYVTGIVILKAILSYLVMDIIYGYFYVKHGLKYSVILHSLYLLFALGVYPFIFMMA